VLIALHCANGDPEFLKTVITGDETWVYGYDPKTKVPSSQWKHSSSPRPKKSTTGVKQSHGAPDFFFTIAGLCITVMHQKATLSTKNTIWKSSVIFVMQFGARDRACGPHAIGNCIIHHT
jgi:hypothetical protein